MGVPSVFKYVKSEDDRKVVELVISQQVFQRSYIAPPGLPAEQLGTLRSAFDATMSDKQFLDDAEKAPHRHLAAARRQGAGAGAEALRDPQGRDRARAPGDLALARHRQRLSREFRIGRDSAVALARRACGVSRPAWGLSPFPRGHGADRVCRLPFSAGSHASPSPPPTVRAA